MITFCSEQPFAVLLIDQETGEMLERDLVGTLDLLELDPDPYSPAPAPTSS